jgi:hypothetical protein
LEHHGACAIAEQHTGIAVVPVDEVGEDIAGNEEHIARRAAADHAGCHVQAIDEAAARCYEIEGGGAARTRIRWMVQAVAGNGRSGVQVARMTVSI